MCKDKEDGGLGIKCIGTQNAFLLLKLLHRLHSDGSAWGLWATEHANLADLSRGLHGTHWVQLRDLLPAYQQITKVSIRDGRNTDFWKDYWLGDAPLATRLPALFSHYVARATSMHDVMRASLCGLF